MIDKLAEYERLEEKLNGISVKQVVCAFIKEKETQEGYERVHILKSEDADSWDKSKEESSANDKKGGV